MSVATESLKQSAYPLTINGRELSRDQANQLMYLETRAVDHGGLCDGAQMNREDIDISQRWNEEGFLYFRRISAADLPKANRYYHGSGGLSHLVILSPDAWACAAALRRARGERNAKVEYQRSPYPDFADRKEGA